MDQRAAMQLINSVPEVAMDTVSYSYLSFDEMEDLCRTSTGDVLYVTARSSGDTVTNTVRDPRFGPRGPNQTCENCLNTQLGCPGHYGLIKTPAFVHPQLSKIVIQVMTSICHGCGELLKKDTDLRKDGLLKYQGVTRLNKIYDSVLKTAGSGELPLCPRGGSVCGPSLFIKNVGHPKDGQYMYKGYETSAQMKEDKTNVGGVEYPPEKIASILAKVSPETSELLGLGGRSPANFVTQGIVVLPYALRQDFVVNGVINESDLTYMFNELVGAVIKYERSRGSPGEVRARMDLYKKYAYLFNNYTEMSKPGKNSRPLISYKTLTQGKEGIIRQLIQAKRVNFHGRTLAGPGAFQMVDEIGIPEVDAATMTIPVIVQEYNLSTMEGIFQNHKFTYIVPGPGHGNNRLRGKLLSKERFVQTVSEVIAIGDTIHRFMQDGDILLVNRQPTLHKFSFAAFRVVLHNDLTIKINLAAVEPFNADFDGDELNYHLLQDPAAYAEAGYLFGAMYNHIDDANMKPLYGLTQNSLTAFHLMLKPAFMIEKTKEKQELTKQELSQTTESQERAMLQNELAQLKTSIKALQTETRLEPDVFRQVIEPAKSMPDFPTLKDRCRRHGVPWGSNRCLVSAAFPARLVYQAGGIVIRDGIWIKGLPGKRDIGTSGRTGGNIMTTIAISLGGDVMLRTLGVAQFIANLYLRFTGFSVGYDDCVVNKEEMRQKIQENLKQADIRLRQLWFTKDIRKMTKQQKIQMEKKFIDIMTNASTEAGNIVDEYYDKDNALVIMAESGAKGDKSNAAMMNLMYGPILVDGKLPKPDAYGRVGPSYDPIDPNLESMGFCATSFGEGLGVRDQFNVNRVGRAGIMAKFVDTAKPGEMLHILNRYIEDASVSSDGRIKYENDMTVQLVYSDNGLNPSKLMNMEVDGYGMPFFCNPLAMANEINHEYLA